MKRAGQICLAVGSEQRRRRRRRQIRSASSSPATTGKWRWRTVETKFSCQISKVLFPQQKSVLFWKTCAAFRTHVGNLSLARVFLLLAHVILLYSAACRSVKSCCASSTASTAADLGTGDGSLSRHVQCSTQAASIP